ncbi:hypothetical protein ZWY2020_028422 [Hordeum vulgare]|nr:hypothetical protein ZWY2020_028422 [Hordeum vulgare]
MGGGAVNDAWIERGQGCRQRDGHGRKQELEGHGLLCGRVDPARRRSKLRHQHAMGGMQSFGQHHPWRLVPVGEEEEILREDERKGEEGEMAGGMVNNEGSVTCGDGLWRQKPGSG